MKILLVSPYFPPQPAVASLRLHAFATTWAAAGAQVTVLTTSKRLDQAGWPRPCSGFEIVEVPYRAPRLFEWVRRRWKGSGEGGGVETGSVVDRFRWLREGRGVFASVRMPDLTDAWVRPAVAWSRTNGPWDLVYSSAGPYTAHLVAGAIKREGRAERWAAEFRDAWVDNPIHRGLFPFTLRERTLERRCLREADLVITVSEPLARMLHRRTTSPVEVVYNGFDPDELAALAPEPAFPNDEKLRLVFTGSLYPSAQDPGPLLHGLRVLRQRRSAVAHRIRLVVAGRYGRPWLEAADRYGVTDLLDVVGEVDRLSSRRMQRDADALVLIDFAPGVSGALTTKAFEYLSVDPPIMLVGGATGTSLAKLVTETGRGLVLGSDPQGIAGALIDLAEGRSLLTGQPDAQLIGTFTRECQAHRLLSILRDQPASRGF